MFASGYIAAMMSMTLENALLLSLHGLLAVAAITDDSFVTSLGHLLVNHCKFLHQLDQVRG